MVKNKKLFVLAVEESISKVLRLVKTNFPEYDYAYVAFNANHRLERRLDGIEIINLHLAIDNIESLTEINNISFTALEKFGSSIIEALIIREHILTDNKNVFLFYNYNFFFIAKSLRKKRKDYQIKTFTFIDSFCWESLENKQKFFFYLNKMLMNKCLGNSSKTSFPKYNDFKEQIQILNSDVVLYEDEEIFYYFLEKYPNSKLQELSPNIWTLDMRVLKNKSIERRSSRNQNKYIAVFTQDSSAKTLKSVVSAIDDLSKKRREEIFFLIYGSAPAFFTENLSIHSRSRLIFSQENHLESLEEIVYNAEFVIILSGNRIESSFFRYLLALKKKIIIGNGTFVPDQIKKAFFEHIIDLQSLSRVRLRDTILKLMERIS